MSSSFSMENIGRKIGINITENSNRKVFSDVTSFLRFLVDIWIKFKWNNDTLCDWKQNSNEYNFTCQSAKISQEIEMC